MKKILNNTWAVLDKKEKTHFSLLIILDIVISIVDILSLALLLWIIQFYIRPANTSNLPLLPRWLADRNSLAFIAIFFCLFGIKNLAGFLISRAHYSFIGGVAIRISRSNLLNYQQAGFREFTDTDSSVYIRKIAFQPFEFCQYYLSGIQQVITQICLILITILAILFFNASLFLLLLCILLPPVVAIFYYTKFRLDTAKKHIRNSNERSFQHLMEALKGYVESNIYNRNEFFLRRFITHRQVFSKYLFESISIQNAPPRIIEVFAVMGLFILIALAKWSGNYDHAALVTIGAFMAAAYKIIPGIVKIINATGQIKAYEFSTQDLVHTAKAGKSGEPENIVPAIYSIELKNISFSYEEQPVLRNFFMHIQKGDFACISGASGKGKTTLFNLLLGFLTPENGEILVNDRPADTKSLTNNWPVVAYVRQQPFFIHDTIERNITLEEEGQNHEMLQYAVRASGLNEFVSKFPEGLNKVITENGKNISGGQQQRIAIARALYKNAGLILLDEPFNELDESSTHLLMQHFREQAEEGKIVIMITHDIKHYSYCNKIISLDE